MFKIICYQEFSSRDLLEIPSIDPRRMVPFGDIHSIAVGPWEDIRPRDLRPGQHKATTHWIFNEQTKSNTYHIMCVQCVQILQ